jgi:type III restriction enzyme
MEFKFDAAQEFQVQAIEAVVRLFDGQGKVEAGLEFAPGIGFVGLPNRLDLDEQTILRNLHALQRDNQVEVDKHLEVIETPIETSQGTLTTKFPNFSIEMETGTGKTYVYIRTALELNKRYGFRKFVIVVPSIAVREGVVKTFEMTRKHFRQLYDNMPYKFYVYDSENLTQLRQFSGSSNAEFMIMTLASFNKAMTEEGSGNVIHRPTDKLQGATPIHVVQSARPILILDEPQEMESEKSVAALSALNPLFAIRYSATHRYPYNLIYRLSPFDAYRQGLVKKIEVASVVRDDDANQAYIKAEDVRSEKKVVTAKVSINRLLRGGVVKIASFIVEPGVNLSDISHLPEYDSYTVEEINPGTRTVRFSNGIELSVGETQGADREAIFQEQIKYTVEEHFRKQRRLRSKGIKVLSLFFIDRVSNYVQADGIIRKAFESAFNELKAKYSEWKDLSPEDVQASYFAFTKRRTGQLELEDSSSGEAEKDKLAYDLIMKDKEELLSFGNKVAFIFSHSALNKGWDNPNVFQICTLNQTSSEMKKRQEVGRGVRLAVDQIGNRVHEPEVNILTVIANQSYDTYVRTLQEEIEEACGPGQAPPKPANARRRTTVTLRKNFTLRPEFRRLWDSIKTKTRYAVTIDTDKLIDDVVRLADNLKIRSSKVVVSKAAVELGKDDTFEALQMSSAKTVLDLAGRYPLPNLTDLMIHLLENTTPPMRISRTTLARIFERTRNDQAALDNPFEFASAVVRIIKDKLADQLIEGIKYEKIDDCYEMTLLQTDFETWEDYVVPTKRGVYDKVMFDSQIERDFVEGLERMDQVRMYIKLPSWFKVETPIGGYNPDWALVWEDRDRHGKPTAKPLLYLVRETKGTTDLRKFQHPDERRKVICGERHFKGALGVDYKVVTSASDLPDGGWP